MTDYIKSRNIYFVPHIILITRITNTNLVYDIACLRCNRTLQGTGIAERLTFVKEHDKCVIPTNRP